MSERQLSSSNAPDFSRLCYESETRLYEERMSRLSEGDREFIRRTYQWERNMKRDDDW